MWNALKIGKPAIALAGILMLAANSMAATEFTVNSIEDEIDNDTSDGICHTAANTCTLRAAVMSANKGGAAGVTILLPAGTYNLKRPPTADPDDDSGGSLKLLAPLTGSPSITITGDGAGVTIIDANQSGDRVLYVADPRTAIISGVTFRNGLSIGAGGGINNAGSLTLTSCTLSTNHAINGAGIYNDPAGHAVIDHCTLSGNMASNSGGGIRNYGTMLITYSTLSGNTAGNTATTGFGGGISTSHAVLSLAHSTVSGNVASAGGGIMTDGTAVLSQSTISGNAAHPSGPELGRGGGIFVFDAVLTVTNSTIALNTADGDGGGIYSYVGANTNVGIFSSTIAYNDANDNLEGGVGGGIFITGSGGNGVNVYNTVMAGNTYSHAPVEDDCDTSSGGALKTHARNLFGGTDGCTITPISGSYATLNPLASLGALKNNGGPTRTIALLAGSNAIDGTVVTGSLCYDSALIVADQRGYPRSGVCDVGAYEYNDIFIDGFQ